MASGSSRWWLSGDIAEAGRAKSDDEVGRAGRAMVVVIGREQVVRGQEGLDAVHDGASIACPVLFQAIQLGSLMACGNAYTHPCTARAQGNIPGKGLFIVLSRRPELAVAGSFTTVMDFSVVACTAIARSTRRAVPDTTRVTYLHASTDRDPHPTCRRRGDYRPGYIARVESIHTLLVFDRPHNI